MTYDVVVDGKTQQVELRRGDKTWLCKVDGQEIEVDAALTARDVLSVLVGAETGPQKLKAPMPGKIVRILVNENDEVKSGQGIVVMEAMKMQNEMKSPKDGRVQKILTAEGSIVNAGDTLAIIE